MSSYQPPTDPVAAAIAEYKAATAQKSAPSAPIDPEAAGNTNEPNLSFGDKFGRFLANVGYGAKETDEGRLNFLRWKYGADKVKPIYKDNELANVEISTERGPMLIDPKGFGSDEIARQVVPMGVKGVAAGLGTAAAVAGTPATGGASLPFALPVGGMASAAAGKLASAIVPGEEKERPIESHAADVALEMGGNLAGGAAGKLVGKLGKGIAPQAMGGTGYGAAAKAASAAKEAVEAGAQAPSVSGAAGTTQGGFAKQMVDLQKRVQQLAGGDFRFTAGEITGAPELVATEQFLARAPKTMGTMAQAKTKQLEFYGKALDAAVEKAARGQADISAGGVADQVRGALEGAIGSLKAARTAAAGPLYSEARSLGGAIGTNNIAQTASGLLDELAMVPKQDIARLKSTLDMFAGESAKEGLPLSKLQGLRSMWRDVAAGKTNIVDNLPIAQSRRIGRTMLDAIERDIAEAADSPAVQKLRQADAIWAEYSKPIDEAATKTVSRLLKLADAGNEEQTAAKIMALEPRQITSLVRTIEKGDPGAVHSLRARAIKDIIEDAGWARETPGASTMFGQSARDVSAAKIASGMSAKADKLNALFAGDKEATEALKTVWEAARGMTPPSAAGGQSITAPMLLWSRAQALAEKIPGPAGRAITEKLSAVPAEAQSAAMAEVLAAPQTAKDFAKIIDAMNNPTWLQSKSKLAGKAIQDITQSLARVAFVAGVNNITGREQ